MKAILAGLAAASLVFVLYWAAGGNFTRGDSLATTLFLAICCGAVAVAFIMSGVVDE
jgi:hypothetical protein